VSMPNSREEKDACKMSEKGISWALKKKATGKSPVWQKIGNDMKDRRNVGGVS